jgi:hypothetical protein
MGFDKKNISHEVPQVLNVFPQNVPNTTTLWKLKHEHPHQTKLDWDSLTNVPYENVKYTLF